MRLSHVRLLVGDYAACFRFYRDVLQLRPVFGDEGSRYADFDASADVAVALFDRSEQAEHIGGSADAGGDRVALIFRVDDVDAAVRELAGRGAAVAAEPADRADWGIRVGYVRDPDGNLVELNQPIPMAL